MKEHNCSYSTRIGKTTFIVNVKQSETAQKPLNTVFQEICKHEVLEDCSADKSSILENHKNHLDKVNPEGTGYRAKTRFAKFFNLPELIALFKESADIQTPDMLKLPVPEAEYENVVLKPSEFQKDMVASLAERAEAVRDRQVQPYEDNMLKITNDGRKLALDQRLLNDMLPDEENSKAATCVEKAYEIWENTKEQKSAQLIFCDLSTPKGDGTFNVYEDIKISSWKRSAGE